jgi:glycosyltransferase involved in cell wall biosynthesis
VGRDFRLFMTLWGADLQKSKELAKTLSIEDLVIWLAPMPRRKLIRWVGAVDCVLDQIRYPCFGATAPEALGCGTPVIMSYESNSTQWIIDEPAPILSAWGPEQIRDHLTSLRDDAFRRELAGKGRAWFQRNHSSRRILKDHLEVYGRLLARTADAGPARRDAA